MREETLMSNDKSKSWPILMQLHDKYSSETIEEVTECSSSYTYEQ